MRKPPCDPRHPPHPGLSSLLAVRPGALTLRVELPLLIIGFQAFDPAYQVVSWLSWVPNVVLAEWIVQRTRRAGVRIAV